MPIITRQQDYFRRHLAPDFLVFFKAGPGKALLEAFKEYALDMRLRDNYVNAYSVGNSVACIWPGRGRKVWLKLRRKYTAGTGLHEVAPRARSRDPEAPELTPYLKIELDREGISTYLKALPIIRAHAQEHAKPEARWEERCIRANARGTSVVVLDRQIAKGADSPAPLPGRKRRSAIRLDMLAVLGGQGQGLVAAELKRDLDARIQHVAGQLYSYLRLLDPRGEGLRPAIAASYATAAEQMRDLGLEAPCPDAIKANAPVHGLLVLANYNERSALLERAQRYARSLDRPMYYCRIGDDDAPLLPRFEKWNRL